MNRQKQILYILLIGLVAALLYAFWAMPEQQTVESAGVSRSATTGATGVAGERTAVGLQKVDLDLLEQGKMRYRGYRRDIFNYYQPKPKAEPKPVARPTPPPVVKPTPPPVEVAPVVRAQLARFTFLGFLDKDDEKTIFLSKGEDIFLVKKNDRFGDNGEFLVEGITKDKLTISQAGASGMIEIALVEKEPLIPSFTPGKLGMRPDLSPSEFEQPETEVKPADEVNPASSVPASEQRRKWFRNTQPPAL